jgi:alpha,alpha-trehalase
LNLAQLYIDPKTVADKPTSRPPQQVLSNFNSTFGTSANPNEGAVLNFTVENFAGEGQELAAVSTPSFNSDPKFLGKVKDNVVKQWSKTVNGYWTQLIRVTNQTNICKGGECESSLIPLNHTFVVPGGRFREQCKQPNIMYIHLVLIHDA